MRILICASHRNLIGGLEKYLNALIPGLLKQRHAISLAHVYPTDRELPTIDGGIPSLPVWCLRELGLRSLLQKASDWAPDLVYFNGLDEPGLEGALLNAYPAMMFAHGYQGTCVSGQKCHAFPTFQPCGRCFGPKCLALYYPRRCGGLSPITALRMYSKQRQLNSWLSVYRAVLVGSKHMYEEYLQHGVPSEKLHLLRMPLVDSTPPATPPLPKTPKGHILFIGRLTNLKGVRYLIEAIPKAAGKLGRSLTLTIAGDGPARLELERFARRREVTSIFTGWIDAVQKSELMRRTDLLAVPSVWPEPFGLVGIEAGSLGVPAVGYSVGGVAEWLIPGQSGELAPGDPPTVDGLSDAIVRALADPAHYAELCLGAWEKSRSFSLDDHLDQLDTLFTIARQAR